MTVELITGQGTTAHIGSEDVGAFQAYTFGTGCYVLAGCEAEVVDANTIRISEGELLIEGRHVRVKGSEDIAIQSGQTGYKRTDLIVVRYTKDTDGIEDSPLVAIVGTPVEGTPTDPSYIQGSILNGDVAADFPLYRVTITDLVPGEPELIMETQDGLIAQIAEIIDALSGKAASSHSHAAGDITSGTLGVARGGTGKATHTSNAVLTGNGTSAVNNVATASGALYATAANGSAKFGTLPVAQGGTGVTTDAALGLKAYPVGAVYISYVSTSPASLFGGTWTAITGKFPYFNAGTGTGGSNTHTLANTQIPPHKHRLRIGWGESNGNNNVLNIATGAGSNWGGAAPFYDDSICDTNGTVLTAGQSHNNMPEYQTLYAWRRTA